MIRRPPRSTLDRSSAASDVYKRQDHQDETMMLIDTLQDEHVLIDRVLGSFRRYVGGPVSYTHLRAHETVLDLVCRLLLEKKKSKKRNKKKKNKKENNINNDKNTGHSTI